MRCAAGRVWAQRRHACRMQCMDAGIVPLTRRISFRPLCKASAVLFVAFVLQWSFSIAAYRVLEVGRPWLPTRDFVRNERGGGAFRINSSATLLAPDFSYTINFAGRPLQIKAPTSIIVGYRSDIWIWGSADHPQNARLRWVKVPGWSRIAEPVDVTAIAESNEFRVIEVAVGWPLPSVRGRVRLQPGNAGPGSKSSWDNRTTSGRSRLQPGSSIAAPPLGAIWNSRSSPSGRCSGGAPPIPR